MAHQRDGESDPDGRAAYRGDKGLREGGDCPEEDIARREILSWLSECREVDAGAERVSGTGEDDRPYRVVIRGSVQLTGHRGEHLRRDGVPFAGSGQGQK